MGGALGLGEAVAAAGGEDVVDGGGEVDAVADGDVEGLDPSAGAEDGADDFVFVDEVDGGAGFFGQIGVATDEE